ncbi:MAG TPA: hypothetical protein VLK82_05410 [Candidatus Tectomicrobia bacterium]|nr:hypothetical protein [Candidatus Tectomicrobia bacterium]
MDEGQVQGLFLGLEAGRLWRRVLAVQPCRSIAVEIRWYLWSGAIRSLQTTVLLATGVDSSQGGR